MNWIIHLLITPVGQLWSEWFPAKRDPQEVFEEQVCRRDRIYGDIGMLRAKRQTLIQQARGAGDVEQQQLVSQIELLDCDLRRLNAQVAAVNKQLNVHNTHRHNKTLIEIAETAGMPTVDQLATTAAIAEECMESLDGAATLCAGIEVGVDIEESAARQSILAEINGVKENKSPQGTQQEVIEAPQGTRQGIGRIVRRPAGVLSDVPPGDSCVSE